MGIVTKITSEGEVVTDFDAAYFRLRAQAKEQKAVTAKGSLRPKAKKINDALDKFKSIIAENSLVTSSSVSVNEIYDRNHGQRTDGYIAYFDVQFKLDKENLDKVDELYDELTSLDDITVYAPSFIVENAYSLNEKAIEKAYDKCMDKFRVQCKILGLVADDYKIDNWNVHYYNDSGDIEDKYLENNPVMLSAAAPAAGGRGTETSINPGKAKIRVNLNIGMAKK